MRPRPAALLSITFQVSFWGSVFSRGIAAWPAPEEANEAAPASSQVPRSGCSLQRPAARLTDAPTRSLSFDSAFSSRSRSSEQTWPCLRSPISSFVAGSVPLEKRIPISGPI